MMNHKTLLFVIDKKTDDNVIAEVAESARAHQTHLVCLLLGSPVPLPYYAFGAPPYGEMFVPDKWVELLEEERSIRETRVEAINNTLERAGASGEVQTVISADADIKHDVARRARICDIAHIAQNVRDDKNLFNGAAYGVLFKTPIGLVLNSDPLSEKNNIFVAWNSSQAASSAIHSALPFIKKAESVTIGCFDPEMTSELDGEDPGTDVAAWLSHHGCNVTVLQLPSGGREVAQCIHDRAREAGADLVVMGAYGHSRTREAVFGGTTRTMMEQTDIPVLLAH